MSYPTVDQEERLRIIELSGIGKRSVWADWIEKHRGLMMAETETQATERLLKLSDEELQKIADDENQRDMVRDIALGILGRPGRDQAADTSPDATDEQVWRANYAGYTEAQLEAVLRDPATYQAQSVAACGLLTERIMARQQTAEKAAQEQDAKEAAERQAAREAAHAEGKPQIVLTHEQARLLSAQRAGLTGGTAPSANQIAAEAFAKTLQDAGMTGATVAQTLSVQEKRVVDGWVVNFHDHVHEIGFVACFWGRGHFVAYVEIAGHMERAKDAAAAFLAAWGAVRG